MKKIKSKTVRDYVMNDMVWKVDKERYVPKCVKTEYVDGERIKADTWYQLKNGEFVEITE